MQERQLICFSNEVFNKTSDNIMILPVPNPSTVKFHNLIPTASFFNDLDSNFFKVSRQETKGIEVPLPILYNVSTPTWVKYEEISVFTSIEELCSSVHNINEDILRSKYPKSFGFVVCKLNQNITEPLKYWPIAYSFDIYKSTSVFLPTLHSSMLQKDWLHTKVGVCEYNIYVMNYDNDTMENLQLESILLGNNVADWTYVPTTYIQLEKEVTIRKISVEIQSNTNFDWVFQVMSPQKIEKTIFQYHVTFPYHEDTIEFTRARWFPAPTWILYRPCLNSHAISSMSGLSIWHRFVMHPEKYIMSNEARQFFQRYSSDPEDVERCRQRQRIYNERARPTEPEPSEVAECCPNFTLTFTNRKGDAIQCHACRKIFQDLKIFLCPVHTTWVPIEHFKSHEDLGGIEIHKLRNKYVRRFHQ